MECAVTNFTEPGDRVLVINGGKFGQRWQQLTEAYQCNVHSIRVEWGQVPEFEDIKSILAEHDDWKAIFVQANETSTGVAYPLADWIPQIKKITNALVIVDAVSGLCAHSLQMDEWGIDIAVGGGQKGFGIDPGLAFIAVQERLKNQLSNRPRFYFDLNKEFAGQDQGQSAWTPATGLLASLDKALGLLEKVGPTQVLEHHRLMATMVRKAGQAMGLSLFASQHPSDALTAFRLPEHIDGKPLIKHLSQRWGTTFAGGQEKLSGKIIRFSHLGFTDPLDVLAGIAALELGLKALGHTCHNGSGVTSAMEVLQDNTSSLAKQPTDC